MVFGKEVFFLFAVYLDSLLEELSASGIGCFWDVHCRCILLC